MKKVIFILFALLVADFSFAQMPEKFVKAMESNIAKMDSAKTKQDWIDLTSSFEKIADAEKNQWLGYYYAAYGHIMIGNNSLGKVFGENADKMEQEADNAESLLGMAESLEKQNSDILCIKNMIAGLRIMANPASNGIKYGPMADKYLATAKKIDPSNPRIYLLEGQSALYKPADWGGGKDVAENLLNQAIEKFNNFKPASSIHPNWGKKRTEQLIAQLKKGS